MYEYAAESYYYGHQYRLYYQVAFRNGPTPPKLSLEFAGEALTWVMQAVLSGVVGNAAYDVLKIVIARIREQVSAGRIPGGDYDALLALSDEELGDLIVSARTYANDLDGITREVRAAIIEEIVADAMSHDPNAAKIPGLPQLRI